MGDRRGSDEWGAAGSVAPAAVDVLIATAGRVAELAVTLAGLAAQDAPPFRVIVSDQSADGASAAPAVQAMVRVLRAQGREVRMLRHLPRRGLAEHRQFLLDESAAEAVLYLDDDVWLEPGALARVSDALDTLGCGFVGMAVQGLSFLDDDRPAQRARFEPWQGPVVPERVRRGTPGFDRWPLHNAANLVHLARDTPIPPRGWLAYKVAWIGACVLYRRAALWMSAGSGSGRRLHPTTRARTSSRSGA
ncbi:glycosyltransferase family A protein [Microbacterium trichothecenolyticum]|uniref:GT2 family glycosyltransferase n=1 Tax=Microbacterium trichothecenolyticum TaxID=69370 RepID=A0ABU0TSG3_MICTR|nr:glycosyltransferase family A protein [Microbacterium trichothecenolyticum]MDQ1122604.1 GT2 family glycosyltransferase [Microbacterium trichothecenolyticum]